MFRTCAVGVRPVDLDASQESWKTRRDGFSKTNGKFSMRVCIIRYPHQCVGDVPTQPVFLLLWKRRRRPVSLFEVLGQRPDGSIRVYKLAEKLLSVWPEFFENDAIIGVLFGPSSKFVPQLIIWFLSICSISILSSF